MLKIISEVVAILFSSRNNSNKVIIATIIPSFPPKRSQSFFHQGTILTSWRARESYLCPWVVAILFSSRNNSNDALVSVLNRHKLDIVAILFSSRNNSNERMWTPSYTISSGQVAILFSSRNNSNFAKKKGWRLIDIEFCRNPFFIKEQF